jgi:hypothetical protein
LRKLNKELYAYKPKRAVSSILAASLRSALRSAVVASLRSLPRLRATLRATSESFNGYAVDFAANEDDALQFLLFGRPLCMSKNTGAKRVYSVFRGMGREFLPDCEALVPRLR